MDRPAAGRVKMRDCAVVLGVIAVWAAACGGGPSDLSEQEARGVALAALRAYEREDAQDLCRRFTRRELEATERGTDGMSCVEAYEMLFAELRRARNGTAIERVERKVMAASYLPGEIVDTRRVDARTVVVEVRQPPPPPLTRAERAALAAQDGAYRDTLEHSLETRRDLVVPVTVVEEDGQPRVELSRKSS